MSTLWRAAVPLLLGVVILVSPPPAGLSPGAWTYFALFVTVIVALITEPIPGAVVGLLGITTATVARLVVPGAEASVRWALSGFSHGTVWLIFVAFMFGLGYEKTGLGRRIALNLVRWLGHRTLGLGYAVAISDLILAPFMPSNTARTGGTVFPIIRSIPALYDSLPGTTARRVGAYLMWVAFAASGVTSSMFLTANAANLFAVQLMKDTFHLEIGWGEWALGFLPVGIVLFALLPLLAYVIYPPQIVTSENVPAWARLELITMGPISRGEVTMAGVACVALALWIFGTAWLSVTTVALAALCIMLLTGVVAWSDMLRRTEAWNVLIWFATLVTLADGLNKVGLLTWFATRTTGALSGLPVVAILALLVGVFFVAHYMFASLTAHATALLPVFLAAGLAVPGLPPRPLALALCYAVGLMGVLTPYATGPAPIFFGSGYIGRREFWLLGMGFGALYLGVLLLIGIPYLLVVVP